jgi:hypothetical protein
MFTTPLLVLAVTISMVAAQTRGVTCPPIDKDDPETAATCARIKCRQITIEPLRTHRARVVPLDDITVTAADKEGGIDSICYAVEFSDLNTAGVFTLGLAVESNTTIGESINFTINDTVTGPIGVSAVTPEHAAERTKEAKAALEIGTNGAADAMSFYITRPESSSSSVVVFKASVNCDDCARFAAANATYSAFVRFEEDICATKCIGIDCVSCSGASHCVDTLRLAMCARRTSSASTTSAVTMSVAISIAISTLIYGLLHF